MSPTVETERLILRKPKEADFEAEAEFMASERSKFLGGPQSRELTWRSFAMWLGHWELRGYGFFAVEEKATGDVLGRVGPWFPEGWPEPEIGWSVFGGSEGRGVAHEAAVAARRFAYEGLGWRTAISLIKDDNTRSKALAERLGAQQESVFEHERFGALAVWRHPSPEACKTSEAA